MALCIMSKRGEERCRDRFFWGRRVGTGHYDFMHNVEVSAKRVRGDGLKKEWGESGAEVGVIEGRVGTLWLYA